MAPMAGPYPDPMAIVFAYEPVRNLACEVLQPVVPSDLARNCIETFFRRFPLMLQIVPQQLFTEHRSIYLRDGIVKFGFSWSLEYAILAVVADLIEPAQSENLATKAKMILEAEVSGRLTTLASTQASVLLGWRECGSPIAGQYSATAAGLIRGFGAYYDPSHFVNTPMMFEEMEARRVMYWSFFVFDR